MRRLMWLAIMLAAAGAAGAAQGRGGQPTRSAEADGYPRGTGGRSGDRNRRGEPDHPGRRRTDPRYRPERRHSRRRRSDRPLTADDRAGLRGHAHPRGDDLQGNPGEQRLLLHVRGRPDAAPRDPGGVERASSSSAQASPSCCDVGNNGLYADTALRQAIEQGWIPGRRSSRPGSIISTTGGQFQPSPEMYKYHNIVYPEYLEANSATRSSRRFARTCCSAPR